MAVPTVATHIIGALAEAGITSIYGVVGDSLNSLTEAVRKYPGINWIGVRHEETGAFAAGAEAQLTGRLADSSYFMNLAMSTCLSTKISNGQDH